MKSCTLALVLVLGASSAAAVDRTPGVVSDLTGTLRIQQSIPCADDVDMTTPVDGGRLEFTPAEGVAVTGGRRFALTRASASFAPFSITRSCTGIDSTTRSFDDVNVQLGSLVSFTAAASGPDTYAISIAPDAVNLYETAKIDGDPESQYLRPTENVTGSVNVATGAVQLHVVVHITEHFRAGCAFGHCIIDEDRPGTLTADLSGTIAFPDADGDGVPDRADNCRFVANPDQSPVPTPEITAAEDVTLASCTDHEIGVAAGVDVCDGGPVSVTSDAPALFHAGVNIVTWTATDAKGRTATATQKVTVVDTVAPTVACAATNPLGSSFIATGDDSCGVTLTLGSFVIANGEQIKIEEVGQPGVRLQNVVGKDGIRKFLVGKSEGVILATDGAGNTSAAICR
jgi:Thrombospondin type 3 repeat